MARDARLYLTQREAAEQLGCSLRTVRRLWAEDRAFRTVRVRGKRLIVRASFARWLETLPE